MHFTVRIVTLSACLFLSGALTAADPDEFLDFSEPDLPGRLYVPPEAESSSRPVILFLHGAGESGTNNTAQINSNVNNLFAAAKERGAFLYAPQATTVVGGIFNWDNTERTSDVMAKVDQVLAEQNADPDRVYITGLSMGGGGTWNMVSRFPDRFAAAVPIAGVRTGQDFEPANLVVTPTWAFHARNDGVVSRTNSHRAIDSILAAAGESAPTYPEVRNRETFEFVAESIDLRYTEFPTGGHGIWGRVYNTPEVYDWMFARSVPESSSNVMILGALIVLTCIRRRP